MGSKLYLFKVKIMYGKDLGVWILRVNMEK